VIALIKAAKSPAEAREQLMGRLWRSKLVEEMLAQVDSGAARPAGLAPEFGLQKGGYRLSEVQAQRILEMQLQRLTGLEQDKIVSEYKEVMEKIVDLLDILAKPARITTIISGELADMKKQYGDERRSEIVEHAQDLSMEDLIASEDVVVTLSHGGYMKCQPVADYRAQKRGGRGKQATTTKDDDFVEKLFIANTHNYILFSIAGAFTGSGLCGSTRQPQPRQADRRLVPLLEHEKITAVLPVKEFDDEHFVFMATATNGQENRIVGIFAAAPERYYCRQPRRRRLPDRSRIDRR
jgi:DNA gyrase subunit A